MEPATYHIPATMDTQQGSLVSVPASLAAGEVGGGETRQFIILSNVHHPSVTPSIVSVPAAQSLIPSHQLPAPVQPATTLNDGCSSFAELTPLAAVPSVATRQFVSTPISAMDTGSNVVYQQLMGGVNSGVAGLLSTQATPSTLVIRSTNSQPAIQPPSVGNSNSNANSASGARAKIVSKISALKVEPHPPAFGGRAKSPGVVVEPVLIVDPTEASQPHTTLLSQQQQLECQTEHLEKMAEKLAEVQKCLENVATTSLDPSLLAFVKCTTELAQLTYVTVAELSGRVGNQAAHINGILLRRGSAAGNTLGSGEYIGGAKGGGTVAKLKDKMQFNLNRCDHRFTLYDPETGKKADLVEIFEKFFIGKPKWHSPEELTMTLTEYVLNTLYPVETEKWTYCVRYSSRNGHKTVPHVLIEEMKMQIAKGFGVFNSVRGVSTNLAVGAAVVNKATRFFNAKRRVSTRASQRKLAGSLRAGAIRNCGNGNNNETSSNKSCSSIDNELEDGGFCAAVHNSDELLSAEGPKEKMARFEERPADSISTHEETRARDLSAYRAVSVGDVHSLDPVKAERSSPRTF